MNKYFGIKDFLFGFLLATLIFVTIGAASSGRSTGRYQVSATGGYYVILDTMTGRARRQIQNDLAKTTTLTKDTTIDWAALLAK